MPSYLVEAYVGEAGAAVDDARKRAFRTASLGTDVVYVRTTYVPEDEMIVHVFEAPSVEALIRAGSIAELAFERIVEAVETSAK